ncbi:hypothetical protein MGYG_02852 [Nannizzia gypsea CBS 118893]|uniref:Uncharacterized protein n=1 Tax=Arthroderma gypseum (strain ATCC MYA-4604 / CBS 118893) TaxID=535722 RepID=E4UPB4_ARTGP|nr:hypothetical protein MGYG_02852 [Nannizzia gypsea CBS 118893]EFQ99840.1 hypothetical protein MGYG_02852 [Nannizzia gypsea CBS 118893]
MDDSQASLILMTCTGAGPGTPLQMLGTSAITYTWLTFLTSTREMLDIYVLTVLVSTYGVTGYYPRMKGPPRWAWSVGIYEESGTPDAALTTV